MKNIDPNIFNPYDIRGIYPDEINEEIIGSIGKAFIDFLRKKYKKKKLKIVISRDNRISSFSLYKSLKKEILKQGIELIALGLSSTPMFYFAVRRFNCDGGVQITASHLAPQYNGCKLVDKEVMMIGENNGLKEIKKMVLSPSLTRAQRRVEKRFISSTLLRESSVKQDVLKDYLKFSFKGVKVKKTKNLKIAIDTGNAVSGILIKEFKKYFPGKIYHLFPELDGNFPNHLPNPLKEKNIGDLKKIVKEKKLDLGVAFDGDGDRIVFIDEKGEMISPDFIICLISEILLRKSKKEKIIYTICSSNIIKEVVERNYGTAIPWKVGQGFIKEKMKKEKAIFGGEYSGHYFLRSHNFSEVPLYILLKVLKEIVESGKSISKLILAYKNPRRSAPQNLDFHGCAVKYKKYFHSGIINFAVKDKKKKLKEIEKKYKKGKISRLDGLRIDFPNYWLNVRSSNTENLLRVALEAKTDALFKKKLKEIKKSIKNPA